MYTIQILSTINDIAIEDYNLFDAYTNEKIERERGCLPEGDCGKSLMSATKDFNNKVAKYE